MKCADWSYNGLWHVLELWLAPVPASSLIAIAPTVAREVPSTIYNVIYPE